MTAVIVLTCTLWQLRGAALVIGRAGGCHGTAPDDLSTRARMDGHSLIEVFPLRMHIEATGPRPYRETIDFDAHL
jgi:hypothetical protein